MKTITLNCTFYDADGAHAPGADIGVADGLADDLIEQGLATLAAAETSDKPPAKQKKAEA